MRPLLFGLAVAFGDDMREANHVFIIVKNPETNLEGDALDVAMTKLNGGYHLPDSQATGAPSGGVPVSVTEGAPAAIVLRLDMTESSNPC